MAKVKRYAWEVSVVLAVWMAPTVGFGADPVRLKETGQKTGATHVHVGLKAEGLYRPPPHPGSDVGQGQEKDKEKSKAETPKPLAMKVETRFEFLERLVKVGAKGTPERSVRRVIRAGSAVNVEKRPLLSVLRPDVAIQVAEASREGVSVFSPGGPLTRSELELVQGPGDPLALASILSDEPVAVGEKWKVGDTAARGLTSYDVIASNGLEARLESMDDAKAVIHLKGEIKGSVLGGEGSVVCDGSCTFDRKSEKIVKLTVERTEARKPGPVEAGLDVKSTLTVTREDAPVPPELADDLLEKYPQEREPARELLLLNAPDGKYSLLHDRSWHTYTQDLRQIVLKRLEKGVDVAQCNLAKAPNAGRGRHQDLTQFRDDIKKGLGGRFGQVVGAGEVDGDPAGGFRYKVAIQGKQGDVGIFWSYYLVASPEGDQLVAIFTMADSMRESFGDEDLTLISSLRWKAAEASGTR